MFFVEEKKLTIVNQSEESQRVTGTPSLANLDLKLKKESSLAQTKLDVIDQPIMKMSTNITRAEQEENLKAAGVFVEEKKLTIVNQSEESQKVTGTPSLANLDLKLKKESSVAQTKLDVIDQPIMKTSTNITRAEQEENLKAAGVFVEEKKLTIVNQSEESQKVTGTPSLANLDLKLKKESSVAQTKLDVIDQPIMKTSTNITRAEQEENLKAAGVFVEEKKLIIVNQSEESQKVTGTPSLANLDLKLKKESSVAQTKLDVIDQPIMKTSTNITRAEQEESLKAAGIFVDERKLTIVNQSEESQRVTGTPSLANLDLKLKKEPSSGQSKLDITDQPIMKTSTNITRAAQEESMKPTISFVEEKKITIVNQSEESQRVTGTPSLANLDLKLTKESSLGQTNLKITDQPIMKTATNVTRAQQDVNVQPIIVFVDEKNIIIVNQSKESQQVSGTPSLANLELKLTREPSAGRTNLKITDQPIMKTSTSVTRAEQEEKLKAAASFEDEMKLIIVDQSKEAQFVTETPSMANLDLSLTREASNSQTKLNVTDQPVLKSVTEITQAEQDVSLKAAAAYADELNITIVDQSDQAKQPTVSPAIAALSLSMNKEASSSQTNLNVIDQPSIKSSTNVIHTTKEMSLEPESLVDDQSVSIVSQTTTPDQIIEIETPINVECQMSQTIVRRQNITEVADMMPTFIQFPRETRPEPRLSASSSSESSDSAARRKRKFTKKKPADTTPRVPRFAPVGDSSELETTSTSDGSGSVVTVIDRFASDTDATIVADDDPNAADKGRTVSFSPFADVARIPEETKPDDDAAQAVDEVGQLQPAADAADRLDDVKAAEEAEKDERERLFKRYSSGMELTPEERAKIADQVEAAEERERLFKRYSSGMELTPEERAKIAEQVEAEEERERLFKRYSSGMELTPEERAKIADKVEAEEERQRLFKRYSSGMELTPEERAKIADEIAKDEERQRQETEKQRLAKMAQVAEVEDETVEDSGIDMVTSVTADMLEVEEMLRRAAEGARVRSESPPSEIRIDTQLTTDEQKRIDIDYRKGAPPEDTTDENQVIVTLTQIVIQLNAQWRSPAKHRNKLAPVQMLVKLFHDWLALRIVFDHPWVGPSPFPRFGLEVECCHVPPTGVPVTC